MGPGKMVLVLWFAAAAVAAPAMGQTDEERFREVSPGFEDQRPLMAGNRFRPVDLRVPMGFDRVYEVVGSGGLYARRSGALTAVFERSVYARDSTPLVPPGTVFYIGKLPVDLGRPGLFSPALGREAGAPSPYLVPTGSVGLAVDRAVSSRPVSRALDLRVGRPEARGLPPARTEGTVWTSEEVRRRRVGQLIRGVAWRWREREAAAGR